MALASWSSKELNRQGILPKLTIVCFDATDNGKDNAYHGEHNQHGNRTQTRNKKGTNSYLEIELKIGTEVNNDIDSETETDIENGL